MKIKVFTTGDDPGEAGDTLTNSFDLWVKQFKNGIDIKQMHTTSNKSGAYYGWSLTILYTIN